MLTKLRVRDAPKHAHHFQDVTMTEPIVVFSHGQDSEPWGSKVLAMAVRARALGFRAESVDYRGIDDPQLRVDKLLAFCKDLPQQTGPVLVGSSLGGHVATAASIELNARGLFLLAPAFYMPGYEHYTPKPAACPIAIVHGWRDAIVPVDNSIRYAREQHATLHVLDADHRMLAQVNTITDYFELFLSALAGAAS
jgi:pimeloyl-ACP methyl ester carboxylesterase